MVKFVAVGPQGVLIGLGLSRKNVERLQAGEPIFIDCARDLKVDEIEFQGLSILVFAGDTEESMQQEINKLMAKGNPFLNISKFSMN